MKRLKRLVLLVILVGAFVLSPLSDGMTATLRTALAGLPVQGLAAGLETARDAVGGAGNVSAGDEVAPETESTAGPVGVIEAVQVDSTPRQGPEADFETRLLECLRSVGTSVDASGLGISPDDGVRLLQEVLAKHPEIFWSNGGCTYTYDSSGLLTFSPKYLYGAGEIPSMRDAYEGRAAQALDWLSGLGISDDADKAKALHDYLVQHAEYSRTQLSGGEVPMVEHTAYGIMVNGTGVCDGYARAYQDLLARSGIPSVVIQSEAMNHAWNLVSVGGTWRHVDVTFDDPVIRDPAGTIVPDDEVRATYFLKSDAYMHAHEHYGWTSDVQATDASLDAKDDWRVFRA